MSEQSRKAAFSDSGGLDDLWETMQRNVPQAGTVAGVVSAIRYEFEDELEKAQSSGPGVPWICTRADLTKKVSRFIPVLDMLEEYTKQSAKNMQQLLDYYEKTRFSTVAETRVDKE